LHSSGWMGVDDPSVATMQERIQMLERLRVFD
jgi:hypothetical protein